MFTVAGRGPVCFAVVVRAVVLAFAAVIVAVVALILAVVAAVFAAVDFVFVAAWSRPSWRSSRRSSLA